MKSGGKAGHTPQRDSSDGAGSFVSPRPVVFGTGGHIDHGKTALVLALTGTDTDRLPEEKARGITIDLGFAALELAGPDGQRFDASLIDVPGHHAFLRNMLAGTGGIDAVLLIVAADEGVRAQTVEHLQICSLLGIRHGLVVLTKSDAVTPVRLEAAHDEIRQAVQGSFLERAPIVAVSALRRTGLAELKAALGRLAASIPERSGTHVARLPVDRVFSAKGFGTVVTGTLQEGTLRAGDSLVLVPGGRAVRVRGLQVHGHARAQANAPNRVALNLAGVDVGEVQRGDVVLPSETLEATLVTDVELSPLPGEEIRHRQRVRVHAFASDCLATVLLYAPPPDKEKTSELALAERSKTPVVRLARLRLDRPLVLLPGDHMVLRQPSPARTLGGAVVLDASPIQRARKSVSGVWLSRLREASDREQAMMRVARRSVQGLRLRQLIAETGWTSTALEALLRQPLSEGMLLRCGGDLLVTAEAIGRLEAQLLKELAISRKAVATRTEVRSKLQAPEPVFLLAVQRMVGRKELRAEGELLQLPERATPNASKPELKGQALQVDLLYRKAGLAAPLVNEAAQTLRIPAGEMRETVTALIRGKHLVRLGSDALLVHAEALAQLCAALAARKGATLDVGAFKQLTGLSRKHAIPLLEYLDGARVTRNAGGIRTIV